MAGTRPSSHRDASRAVEGNGVPSSRAIVRSTASSISRVTGGSSWRSHARWPYLVRPDEDGLAQVVQLDPAVPGPGPHVGQGAAELGVPHQRRQVVDDHGHAHVVDRAVGGHLDRTVGHGAPAEQPHITGAGQIQGLIQGDARGGHALA